MIHPFKIKDNPFTKEFYEEELKRVTFPPTDNGSVTIEHYKLEGRLDGYMYKDFVVDYPEAPVFKIDGKTWMSVTPMEVESHYMPIQLANGRVGVGGLGIGYYTQRILNSPHVYEVVVYEADKDVIDTYLENFGLHSKLTIHHMDVLEVEGEQFDFFYCDIYQSGGEIEALEHMKKLLYNNIIDHYHFWTMEMFILAMMNDGYGNDVPDAWDRNGYIPFIMNLVATKGNLVDVFLDGEEIAHKLHDLELYDII